MTKENNQTKTTKNASLGFTGAVKTEKKEKKVVIATVAGYSASVPNIKDERRTETSAYLKHLQQKDIYEKGTNKYVYNAIIESIVINYAKAWKNTHTLKLNISGLNAVTFTFASLAQQGILENVSIKIADTATADITYTLIDINLINPFKLKEIADTHKLDIEVQFPKDFNDGAEPSFEW